MTKLSVLEYPNPILKQVCKPVETVDAEIRQLIDDMFETMYEDHGGGLAANQIGVSKRIFVMDDSSDKSGQKVFINPEILEMRDELNETEGCLSFPGVTAKVKRSRYIRVKALDYDGNEFEVEYEGDYCSRCVQHETDHLNGITFFDHLGPVKRLMLEKKLAKYRKLQM